MKTTTQSIWVRRRHHQDGFTFVEILFVVSIIALFASVVMTSVQVARAKAEDTERKAEVASVSTAISMYYNDKGRMPSNYYCGSGTCIPVATRAIPAKEDADHPTNPTTEPGRAYNRSMQDLVDGGYLEDVPHAPEGSEYGYYDYGPGTDEGAVFGTDLEIASSEGGATCRESGFYFCYANLALYYDDPSTGQASFCFFEPSQPEYQRCYQSNSCGYRIYMDGSNTRVNTVYGWCGSSSGSTYCRCNSY